MSKRERDRKLRNLIVEEYKVCLECSRKTAGGSNDLCERRKGKSYPRPTGPEGEKARLPNVITADRSGSCADELEETMNDRFAKEWA